MGARNFCAWFQSHKYNVVYRMNAIKDFLTSRPLSVTIVSLLVLCITAWNGIRAFAALTYWEVLARFNGNLAYVAASGLVWCIGGLVLSMMLLTRKRFALHVGLISSIIYIIWYWVDRLAVQISPASNGTYSAIVSISVFAIFNIALFWPSSRVFFTSAGKHKNAR
jgi:hypothetical protein